MNTSQRTEIPRAGAGTATRQKFIDVASRSYGRVIGSFLRSCTIVLAIVSSAGRSGVVKPSPRTSTLGTRSGLMVPAQVSGCPSTRSSWGTAGSADQGAAMVMLAVAVNPFHVAVMGMLAPTASPAVILSCPALLPPGTTLAGGV